MAKIFNRVFTLSDEKTTKKAFFKMPSATVGLSLLSCVKEEMREEHISKVTDIAIKHLVIVNDDKTEMTFKTLEELSYIFEDIFIGVVVFKEFLTDIAPLLTSSLSRLNSANAEKR